MSPNYTALQSKSRGVAVHLRHLLAAYLATKAESKCRPIYLFFQEHSVSHVPELINNFLLACASSLESYFTLVMQPVL